MAPKGIDFDLFAGLDASLNFDIVRDGYYYEQTSMNSLSMLNPITTLTSSEFFVGQMTPLSLNLHYQLFDGDFVIRGAPYVDVAKNIYSFADHLSEAKIHKINLILDKKLFDHEYGIEYLIVSYQEEEIDVKDSGDWAGYSLSQMNSIKDIKISKNDHQGALLNDQTIDWQHYVFKAYGNLIVKMKIFKLTSDGKKIYGEFSKTFHQAQESINIKASDFLFQ